MKIFGFVKGLFKRTKQPSTIAGGLSLAGLAGIVSGEAWFDVIGAAAIAIASFYETIRDEQVK
jgi:uncharacterized membrane protein